VRLTVQAAEREVMSKSMQIIENPIQSKVSALCVTPSGSREIVPAIVKANRAGIPVVILDTRVHPRLCRSRGKVSSFIGSDNFEGGRLAGEFIPRSWVAAARSRCLKASPHETGDSRLKGFHTAVDTHPGIQVVASQTANWERDRDTMCFKTSCSRIRRCKRCMQRSDGPWCCRSDRSGGEDRKDHRGFDAFSEAREAVLKGTMDATIAQSPADMGRLAIENVACCFEGKRFLKRFR
jgi:ribose transport system substrate-binding protein